MTETREGGPPVAAVPDTRLVTGTSDAPPKGSVVEVGQAARPFLDRPAWVHAVALAALLLVLAFLWGRGRDIWYWLDEGLSVGFSSHPLGDIPRLLRQDGSPPLYYWLLHLWMSAVGSAEAQTHTLSLLFALGGVVAAWWAGLTLFGRRTAWVLTVVFALNPFLAAYANETRMYSLVVLLSTVATGSYLHVFVYGRSRYLPVFVVSLALLLYTHNWALFFTLGTGAGLVPCLLVSSDRRRVLRDAVLGFGAVGLLYLPWLPTVLNQRAHTGAPWSPRPTLQLVREQLADLIGGREAAVALGLGAGAALAAFVRRPWGRMSAVVGAMSATVAVTLGSAWLMSRGNSVWTYRYLAVALPAVLIVVAVGLSSGGRLALAALAVIAFLAAPIDVRRPAYQKSNMRSVTADASAYLRAGDLVISPDYGEVPLLAHYLGPRLEYATSEGLVADRFVADQRDSTERLLNSRYASALPPLLDALPTGGHVLVVCPPVTDRPDYTKFLRLIMQRCADVNRLVLGDGRMHVELTVDGSALDAQNTPISAILVTKQAPTG